MDIEKGMKFYDERNDRYLKVWSVNKGLNVAQCGVFELDADGAYELSQIGLFTFDELGHFKEV